MKRKKRSTVHCLICVKNCSEKIFLKSDIPGAVHCVTLHRQLQNLFILHHILEIDLSWCINTLQKRSEAEEEFNRIFDLGEDNPDPTSKNGDLGFWFMLCNDCVPRVEEAWRVYQKLLGIQSQMNAIKSEIKETMKEAMKKAPKTKGVQDDGIDDEIRKMVHPDIGFQEEVCYDDDDIQEDLYFDDDGDDPEFVLHQSENENEVKVDILESNSSCNLKSKGLFTRGSFSSRKFKRRKRLRTRPSPPSNLGKSRKYRYWSCPKCVIRYKNEDVDKIRTHLERHKNSEEMGGGEFDCSQCNFPAQDCLELDRHIRIRHINNKNHYVYPCPKCKVKCRGWKSLKAHANEHHPELTDEDLGGHVGTLLCSECPRTFLTSRALAAHQRALHPHLLGAEQEEVQCDQCDLKFTSKIYLQAHINNVHKNEERKFMCDDCGKSFPFLSKLKRHKVTHVNETKRIYCCEICGVDYAHQEILIRHMRKFHSKNDSGNQEMLKCRYCPFQTPFLPALKKHTASHKEDMGFKCSKCGKTYTKLQGLKRHERVNHSDTLVPCPYCNKKYISVDYMRDHVKKFCKMKELKEQQQQNLNSIDDLIAVSTESRRLVIGSQHEIDRHEQAMEYEGQTIILSNSNTDDQKLELPFKVDHI